MPLPHHCRHFFRLTAVIRANDAVFCRCILVALVALILSACSTVPVTGRSQLSIIPGESMLAMSAEEYGAFLKGSKVSQNPQQTALVKKTGERIRLAVERYFAAKGLQKQLQDYRWEFNLVEDKQVNAWCMPGGRVVVYTGILPIAGDEAGLAVVMGHEIAHAVAGHGNERMSQELIAQLGSVALATAVKTQPEATRKTWMSVYGAGAQYGALMPYGRLQENEADELGLVFMTLAGYDPDAAVAFWERMAAEKKGTALPEFLSTHPADASRIANLRRLIPQVRKEYGPIRP